MTRRFLHASAAVLLAALPVLATAQQAAADEPAPKKLFTMTDGRITESSSLVRSAKHDDVWWTANDSSDSARVFAVGADGEVKAEVTFSAEPRDVEALGIGTNGRIYVADIGDNLSNQDKVTVYSIPEPDELEDQQVKVRAYEFKYPDGPHNAEALLVNPQTNRLYIVTKEVPKSAVYAAPTPDEMSRSEVNDLEKIGSAPAIVTDGTFTPDGKQVILRSVNSMTVLSWPALKQTASRSLPLQPVGESLSMGPDDKSVLVGSEGRSSAVFQVTIPTATSKPSPTPTPKPASSGSGSGSNGGDAKQSHTMRWTLIGAGAFAALMAMFTFPRGRRERADAVLETQRRRSTT